jgi:pyridinium-3,5-bisthiocarboxylic acid mononucleotide nickel chelatase
VTADRHAWIDASAGIAGDMLLGALVDAGADLAAIQSAVDAVVPGAVRLSATTVTRAGLRAMRLHVEPLVADPPHRTWITIRDLLAEAVLPERTRDRALAVFARLGEAEAHVHGIPAGDVHFHEVGALDSVADVVGVCAALDDLGIATVTAGEVAVGSGRARTAHGDLPVPVPAVAQLARGWRVRSGGTGELATPTGMAAVRALAARCEELPPLTLEAVGVGAGGRDTPGRANVVRVLIGTPPSRAAHRPIPQPTARVTAPPPHATPAHHPDAAAVIPAPPPEPTPDPDPEPAVLIEANIDDLDPRLWPEILAGLLRCGAADAWLVPILMKKGRPAHTLGVLCHPDRAEALRQRVFRDTSTLGLRESTLRKYPLARAFVEVGVPGGSIAVKVGHTRGVIVQVTPEFRDVASLARRLGRAERQVLDEAATAAATAGLVVGATVPAHARPA